MGKNEIDRLRPSQISMHIGCKTNMNKPITLYMPNTQEIHTNENDDSEEKPTLPAGMEVFEYQVAGHTKNGAMIKSNGTVFKRISNSIRGEQELCFYKELNATCDTSLNQMKEFVPKNYGGETILIDDQMVNYLVLEDLTKGYKEPCIMDIKIGRRTWDPMATYEKIVTEDEKYKDTKRDLGFCIPGFQVYKATNGNLRKFGKEYGKKLNKDSIIDALKIFLNADIAWNRNLLVQLLVHLWKIQNWARKQRTIRLYSSSILLIYDARRLRQTLQLNGTIKPMKVKKVLQRANSLYRPLSLAVLHDKEAFKTGFSGQLNADGPIFPNTMKSRLCDGLHMPDRIAEKKAVPTLKRMHSFQNNYDKDLQNIKNNYVFMLDDLVTEDKNELWATVKMIDFAHVYPAENHSLDLNYLDGIENVVKIFEGFLAESDQRN